MTRSSIPTAVRPTIDAMTELAIDKESGAPKSDILKSERKIVKRLKALAKKSKKWAIVLGYIAAGALATATMYAASQRVSWPESWDLKKFMVSGGRIEQVQKLTHNLSQKNGRNNLHVNVELPMVGNKNVYQPFAAKITSHGFDAQGRPFHEVRYSPFERQKMVKGWTPVQAKYGNVHYIEPKVRV